MTDRSKPRMSTIYLYVPNIIGYIRVLMNCVAFGICFSHKGIFSVLYFVSFVCDGIDGWFARKLNQVSTFGAVLDMVTDRISTACLLVILSQIYRPSLIFVSLLALDIASHWFQMYSTFLAGKASHKDVKDSTSWLFRLYYGNRMFMAYCCVSCEVLYIILFLLAKSQSEDVFDVLVSSRKQSLTLFLLEVLALFGWAVKQTINVIQMRAFYMTLTANRSSEVLTFHMHHSVEYSLFELNDTNGVTHHIERPIEDLLTRTAQMLSEASKINP